MQQKGEAVGRTSTARACSCGACPERDSFLHTGTQAITHLKRDRDSILEDVEAVHCISTGRACSCGEFQERGPATKYQGIRHLKRARDLIHEVGEAVSHASTGLAGIP